MPMWGRLPGDALWGVPQLHCAANGTRREGGQMTPLLHNPCQRRPAVARPARPQLGPSCSNSIRLTSNLHLLPQLLDDDRAAPNLFRRKFENDKALTTSRLFSPRHSAAVPTCTPPRSPRTTPQVPAFARLPSWHPVSTDIESCLVQRRRHLTCRVILLPRALQPLVIVSSTAGTQFQPAHISRHHSANNSEAESR